MTFLTPFIISIIAAIVASCGVVSAIYFQKKFNLSFFVAFAAGMLISVSFTQIAPESFEISHNAPFFLLAGYVAMFLIGQGVDLYVCNKPYNYSIGIVSIIGIGFHSFIDGVVYSITFSHSTSLGLFAATGLIIHEFAEGMVTTVLLLKSGFDKKTALILALLSSAITTPVGVIVSYPFIQDIGENTLGLLLSVSAGALIYISATHLLPHTHKEKHSIIGFIMGVLTMLLCSHSHL